MNEHTERTDYKKIKHDPRYYEEMRDFCILEPVAETDKEAMVEEEKGKARADERPDEETRPGSTMALPESVPINLVLPENMMVIPKIIQSPGDMARNRRRARWVRIKSVVVYVLVMIVVILIVNVIWQVVTHPDLSLSDWMGTLGRF